MAYLALIKAGEKNLQISTSKNSTTINGRTTAQPPGDDRLFPFTDNIANQMFEHAVRSAGLSEQDETTNRAKLHAQQL
jgi:hypothetical protein